MKEGEFILLNNGQKAIVKFGEESNYKYCCIVKLKNGTMKIVERKDILRVLS